MDAYTLPIEIASKTMSTPSIDILQKLLSFQSITRQSNMDLILYVKDLLASYGIESQIIHDETGTKANLFASVGPKDVPGIILSGHTDVVPVEGQAWTKPPFEATFEGGNIYGRGSADMKGFIACAIHVMTLASKMELKRPLQLALSYDEEVGCIGVRRLIDVLEAAPVRPFACLIGEPTDMVIATGHKGKTFLKGCCYGLEGHSALAPNAGNAIYLACDMISSIRDMQQSVQESGARDAAYDIPYTTLHVGTIRGGKALNIVPNLCEFDFEIRNLAADDPMKMVDQLRERGEQVAQRSRAIFPKARVDVEVLNSYPGLDSEESDEGFQFLAQLAETSNRVKVAFGTEGGLFASRLSVPVAVCGPGSITHAHKPDEFVSIEQLGKCDAMMQKLLGVLQA